MKLTGSKGCVRIIKSKVTALEECNQKSFDDNNSYMKTKIYVDNRDEPFLVKEDIDTVDNMM
jgi:hypothetical protein